MDTKTKYTKSQALVCGRCPKSLPEIAQATRRDLTFQAITVEQYVNELRKAQVPADYLWLIEYLFTNVLDGRNASTTDVLEKVLGRKPKDFATYVAETAKTGVWDAQVAYVI